MDFLIKNWYTIFLGVLLLTSVIINILKFSKLTSAERYEQIRGWLLQAVIWAEATYGSGTGRLKLSEVYALFCEQLPWIAQVISFETFSQYVDDALEEMRQLLSSNAAIADFVKLAGNKED